MNLTILNQTTIAVTVGWTPVPGCAGYVFLRDGVRVSNTWDPTRRQVKFALDGKPHVFAVQAVSVADSGTIQIGVPAPSPQPSPPPPPTPGGFNSVAQIIADMEPPSEGAAHGAVRQTAMLSYNAPPAGTASVEAWGQVYADASNVYPANVRVEVKNMETHVWSKSQKKWVRVQAVKEPGGTLYAYNFASHIASDKRSEPDGGVSVTMQDKYLFHFFPTAHAPVTESDVGGIFVTCAARLILDNPAGPNNLAQAKFLANVGADFYPAGGTYSFNNNANVGIGGGKYKYLTAQWKPLNFYTGGPPAVIDAPTTKYPTQAWTETQLETNPPALNTMGQP